MKFLKKQIVLLSAFFCIGFAQANIPTTLQKKWEVADHVKQELDRIFTDPKAQEIIHHEQTLKQKVLSLFSKAKRIGEISNIVPKKPSRNAGDTFFESALWRALCHPLKNPLILFTLREVHPLKRALENPYFPCVLQGSSAFIFPNNPILKSYVIKLSLGKRLETAQTIQDIIEKLNLHSIAVPNKFLYHVPLSQETLVIAERIPDDALEQRKLRQEETNDIIKVLIILDYLKIPFLDLHRDSNMLRTKDTCFLNDTESFWKIGAYYDYLPNTRAFLKHAYGSDYTLPSPEEVQQIIDQYTSAA